MTTSALEIHLFRVIDVTRELEFEILTHGTDEFRRLRNFLVALSSFTDCKFDEEFFDPSQHEVAFPCDYDTLKPATDALALEVSRTSDPCKLFFLSCYLVFLRCFTVEGIHVTTTVEGYDLLLRDLTDALFNFPPID